jgi:hypothetical protein
MLSDNNMLSDNMMFSDNMLSNKLFFQPWAIVLSDNMLSDDIAENNDVIK